jgi:hypothetical protein
MGVWIIIEAKTGGRKKPIPKGSHIYGGFGGKRYTTPKGSNKHHLTFLQLLSPVGIQMVRNIRLDYNRSKNRGAKKTDPEGITYLRGVGGKKLYDPEGVEQAPFNVFANVVSRWDTDGEVNLMFDD